MAEYTWLDLGFRPKITSRMELRIPALEELAKVSSVETLRN
jgi:hypothetical protein